VRLQNKIALITGAGAGIGRETAVLFAKEGAKVLIAEFDEKTGSSAAADINAQGGQAVFCKTDVTQPDDVQAAIENCVSTFGGLDILYNNVGGSTINDGPVTTAPFEEFRKKIEIDLFGTWLGCRFAVPHMIKRGGGSIVNASSMCALMGTPMKDSYTAAKGAVTALTMSMAVEFAQHNIRVNAVAPAATLTERAKRIFEQDGVTAKIAERYLLGLVDPIDVAYAILYLASDESRRTTGHILPVDSGVTMS